MRTTTAGLLAVAALGVAACGDDNNKAAVDNSVTPAQTVPPATATGPTTTKLVISKDRKTKPTIPKPSGRPPAKLVIQDVVKGHGNPVRSTNEVLTIDYVGASYSTGTEFDSSWSRNQPSVYPLTTYIPGWQQGILGMKAGGRRVLIIPPDLAYGDSPPQGAGIGPGETLIFVVDLRKIGG
jgi:peptidylprolyl isomerase